MVLKEGKRFYKNLERRWKEEDDWILEPSQGYKEFMEKKMTTCIICNKELGFHIHKHRLISEIITPTPQGPICEKCYKSNYCFSCGKGYSTEYSLKRHFRSKKHSINLDSLY